MSMEFIATQTSTGDDFTEFTFDDAVDFDDYSEMYCTFSLGTGGSRDLLVRFGDSGESGVLTTSTYSLITSNINAGALSTGSAVTGEPSLYIATHPVIDSEEGIAGSVRIYLNRDSSGVTRLSLLSTNEGKDALFITTGYNTTTQDDLKYFRLYVNSDDLISGSNVTCYKMKRS